jgi:hypothetical protein
VVRDQGVAWSRLDCFKPSLLALTSKVRESWMDTRTEETYRGYGLRSLYSLVSSRRVRQHVKGMNGNLNHSKGANCGETERTYVRANLLWFQSLRSSRREGKPLTWRRQAGRSVECEQRYAKGRKANGRRSTLARPGMAGEPDTKKLVRPVCAVRRFEIFLSQTGGTGEKFLSYQLTRWRKPEGTTACWGSNACLKAL